MNTNKPALLVGLPRSRTYWFSELISAHEGGYGFHELVRTASGPEEYKEIMLQPITETIVDCTSMPINIGQHCKLVYIMRDRRSIHNSLAVLPSFQGLSRTEIEARITAIQDYQRNLMPSLTDDTYKLVSYEALIDDEVVAGALNHLGIEADMKLIREFQSKKLCAPYMEVSTAKEMDTYGQLLAERYFK